MTLKKFAAAAFAALMLSFTACGANSTESSSEKSESSAASEVSSESVEESAAESAVGTTDYDVNGDERAFDKLAQTYSEGYLLELEYLSYDDQQSQYTLTTNIADEKVYRAIVSAGMKTYTVAPGDGYSYTVYEATTTYTKEEIQQEEFVTSLDILFGAVGDFVSAEIDTDTNTVYEHYSLLEEVSEASGEIIFGFDGETYELTDILISLEGVEYPETYTVTSISAPDETLLEVPDVSAYTEN